MRLLMAPLALQIHTAVYPHKRVLLISNSIKGQVNHNFGIMTFKPSFRSLFVTMI
uniref:Uncharacterized protein n=1 Tax=Anguilla anguilla TaxID=7936 RepID=A0A0E9WSS2_ANGAN